MKFDIKSFHTLWRRKLDVDQRMELIRLADFTEKQYNIFVYTEVKGYTNKEVAKILDYEDTRRVERLKNKAIQRILDVINNPKNNRFYSKQISA